MHDLFCGACGLRFGSPTPQCPRCGALTTPIPTQPISTIPNQPTTMYPAPFSPNTATQLTAAAQKKWRPKRPLVIACAAALILVLGGLLLLVRSQTPTRHGTTPFSTTIGGITYSLGITDGSNGPDPFASNDLNQIEVLGLIFTANKQIAASDNHFTVILNATLSRSNTDQDQSESIGVEQLRGAYLSQLDYNAVSSVKMRILVANIGTKPIADQAAAQVSEQIVDYEKNAPSYDHFVGVEGFPFSRTVTYGLPTLAANGNCLPVISPSASSDTLNDKVSSCFHRVISPDSWQNPYEVDFIRSLNLSSRTILLSADTDDTYSVDFASFMKTQLSTDGYQVVEIDYKESSSSIANFLVQVSAQEGQGVVFGLWMDTGYPTQLSQIRDGAAAQGIPLPTAMGGGAFYEVKGYAAGDFTNEYFSSTVYGDGPNQLQEAFQAQYRLIYHKDSLPKQLSLTQAMLEYDAFSAFQKAVGRSSDLTPLAVEQSLESLSFTGITGPIHFGSADSNPGNNRPLYILCAKNGTVHWLVEYITLTKKIMGEPLSVCS
ncbi:MAG TPA: ABC transporter substrate-binding protein [Candidatus Acidoferrum sp.]|nr:ABC transporter substrate-binding protein [Candidatus Acidoferrum sp.]